MTDSTARRDPQSAEDLEEAAAIFTNLRPRLFGIGYRMLSSASEAVNGRAGLAVRRAGRAIAVVGTETADGKVSALWIVLNPAKLDGWHRG